jgi:hypothetical protein
MSTSEPLPDEPESSAVRVGTAVVVEVPNDDLVVINRGTRDGIKVGLKYLIFGLGPELKDPETGEDLGRLELVRGVGVVTHVQPRMATLTSARRSANVRRKVTKKNPVLGYLGTTEEETFEDPGELLPFNKAEKGDIARRI